MQIFQHFYDGRQSNSKLIKSKQGKGEFSSAVKPCYDLIINLTAKIFAQQKDLRELCIFCRARVLTKSKSYIS